MILTPDLLRVTVNQLEIPESMKSWKGNSGCLVSVVESPVLKEFLSYLDKPTVAIFASGFTFQKKDRQSPRTVFGHSNTQTIIDFLGRRYGSTKNVVVIPLSVINRKTRLYIKAFSDTSLGLSSKKLEVKLVGCNCPVTGGAHPDFVEDPLSVLSTGQLLTMPEKLAQTSDILLAMWKIRRYSIPTMYQVRTSGGDTSEFDKVIKRNRKVEARRAVLTERLTENQ